MVRRLSSFKGRIASEEDLFAMLGMPFIPPDGRTEMRYKALAGGVKMIGLERKNYLQSLGFQIVQFDTKGHLMGLSKDQIRDPNHFAAYWYPYGKNNLYWSWPMPSAPATEDKCWAAIEKPVTTNKIDFKTFKA